MIQTEHITKSFGRTRILSGISLHVRDRELVAYLGPNGAGKTTTVRILSGQARADGGTVKLAGRNLTEHPLEAKALCGVVSQHLNTGKSGHPRTAFRHERIREKGRDHQFA